MNERLNSSEKATRTALVFRPEVVAADGGFEVRAGKRAVMARPGVPLRLPNGAIAAAIAAEWHAAGAAAALKELPLARMAVATAEVAGDRAPIDTAILAYASTDLVCYWSDDSEPAALRAAQAAEWQPLLDWLAEAHGARLCSVRGIAPVEQDAVVVERLRAVVAAFAPHELVGLRFASAASGSLVIGLALCAGAWSAERAYTASAVDEAFQMERWGADDEAADVLAIRRVDLANAERFLKLWRGQG